MIRLVGLSSSLCKTKTVTKYKVNKESGEVQQRDEGSTEKVAELADFEFEFVSWEENVSFGDEFVTGVEMRNNLERVVNVSVYSYVIDGRARLSEGLTEDGVWKKSWTGNERELSVGPGEYVVVNLTNRMQKNVTGNYTLKVKVKGDVDDEIAREINVIEAVVVDDFFRVLCNATDRKTYLFLANGEAHERDVVVLSSGREGAGRRVAVDKGEMKQVTYLGRVDEFVVEYEGEVVVCRPEHDDYDVELEARGEEEGVMMMGGGAEKMSFIDRVIRLFFSFFGS